MNEDKSICRDYERGVCNRGNKCKFTHPDNVQESHNQKLPICKDYQNKGCDRVKCKFLHITSDEEAEYMRTGVLPSHEGHPPSRSRGANSVSADVCKDFLNNICQRGSRCKFRHVSETDYQMEQVAPPSIMYGKRRRDEYSELTEENEMLRRKITDLQRQVLDLRQMNDTLYDQNTRYRNQLRGQTAPDAYGSAKSVAYPSSATGSGMSRGAAYDSYTPF